ncbi:nodulation protein NfeD [Herbaspirillum sp. HC18]|nr:nodulation protein NfeD [Herbaspirillum sp. HC18]
MACPSFFRRLLVLASFMLAAGTAHTAAPVKVLTLDGAVTPASADYVQRGIARARDDNAQLIVLQMDTPGGLDLAMRNIIKAILSSPIPVAAYVGPSGARAASAGTYILYAAHVAAMAPGTNLGAATPVRIGIGGDGQPPKEERKDKDKDKSPGGIPGEPSTEPMTRKQVNDAAAYIRGLAQLRGRNAEWAERAVREAVSLSASEALKQHVIDFVAPDIAQLLKQLDGRKIMTPAGERRLQTADAPVLSTPPDWRTTFLSVITDPGIALMLLTIGIYGLIFEFMNPGFAVPGVVGGICLVLALYAFQLLPVNYAGLALILLGISFMVAEAFLASFGALGIGGIAAFIAGAIILIDTDQPGFGIPLSLIATVALAFAAGIAALVGVALKTRRLAVVSGGEALIGSKGEVINVADGQAWVFVHGERWQAIADASLRPGQRVRVVARKGLVLEVAPQEEN